MGSFPGTKIDPTFLSLAQPFLLRSKQLVSFQLRKNLSRQLKTTKIILVQCIVRFYSYN